VFAHLSVFNHRYQLIEPRETEILQDLVVALKILDNDDDDNDDDDNNKDDDDDRTAAATDGDESTDDYNRGVINKEPTMSSADQPINMFPNLYPPTNTDVDYST